MAFERDLLRRCWVLAGPTASGKTAAGIVLARLLDGEVVSLDSMAVYRGMDIGTAKPTPAEQSQVRHHLIDVADPWDDYSIADYLTAAEACCREIVSRGKTPVFVGGTGLYLRGLLRGLCDTPAADWAIRQRLQLEVEQLGEQALHDRLAQVDPPTAARLHPHDTRRVIRALEVFETTGQPLSAFHEQQPLPPGDRPRCVAWLSPPRDWIHHRIDTRVERMFEQGLVDEVRRLLANDRPLSHTASQALGYREVLEHLQGGMTLAECVTAVQQHTRQFAKRQHTWFRNLAECEPVSMAGGETAEELADRIVAVSAPS